MPGSQALVKQIWWIENVIFIVHYYMNCFYSRHSNSRSFLLGLQTSSCYLFTTSHFFMFEYFFFEHTCNSSIIGCFVSILAVLTSTASGLVWEEMFVLMSWALQACVEVCACDRTPPRERLE